MTIRERIAAYKAAVGPTASGELRYALSDTDGMTLAVEIGVSEFRFAARLDAAIERAGAAVVAMKKAGDDVGRLAEGGVKFKEAADYFWDSFEGEQIEGVTIIRRRA